MRNTLSLASLKLNSFITVIVVFLLILVLSKGSVLAADVNVLIIGSTEDTITSGKVNGTSVPFTPTAVATELQSILDGAGLGTINVTLENRAATSGVAWDRSIRMENTPYSSYGYNIASGSDSWYQGAVPHTLAAWFHFPYLPKADGWERDYDVNHRWPNLRGELGTQWDYVILIGDPHTMEYFPGVYAHGVAKIGEEVAKGTAETVLLMPWPGPGSDSTVAHYKEIVYRAGRSGGYKVAPAGLAWLAAGSPVGATHPSADGAYIAAASIYSRLWNKNANESSYTYGDGSLAGTVYTTVTDAVDSPQYSGAFNFQSPFKMDYIRSRQIRPIHWGASHHQGYTDGAIRAALRCNVDANQNQKDYHNVWHLGMYVSYDSTDNYYYQPNFSTDMVFAYKRHDFYVDGNWNNCGRPEPGHIAMMNDFEIYQMTEELIAADNMRSRSDKSRLSLHRVLWAQIHQEFPDESILGDWQHFDRVAEDAAGTYMFTLMSGRCSVDYPKPTGLSDARWLAQKVGYETAWRVANCVSRAPGFKVMPSAKDKMTITHAAPETMTVQFVLPPRDNVTVNVSLSNESVAIIAPRTLIFTPENYSTPQQVVIAPLNGSTPSETVNVQFSTTSNDDVYNGLADSWEYTVVRDLEPVTQVDNGTTSVQTLQNTPVTIDLKATGANSNNTTFVGSSYGAFTWKGLGVIEYTPKADFIGRDGIAYAATVNGIQTKGYLDINVVAPANQVSVAVADSGASEQGPTTGAFTFSRLGSISGDMTVVFTMGGTAISGADYTLSDSGSVTIPDGQSSTTVILSPINDSDFEGNETVTLTITSHAAYIIGVSTASMTIEDNDGPIITTSPWADVNPILDSASATLHVLASYAGALPLTYTWSEVSGYGNVTFSPNSTDASANTSASFSCAGFYVLKVTVSDGISSVSDNVTITVLHDLSNLLAPVIYEPFDQPNANAMLHGQTVTGHGLQGNWAYTNASSNGLNVENNGLSFGAIPTNGNLHTSYTGRRKGNVANLDTSLSNSGLLNHGQTLWFGILHRIAPGSNSNASASFALGTGATSYGFPPSIHNGQGIGFWIQYGNMLHAAAWNGAIITGTPVDMAPTGAEYGSTVLIVGKVIWGADEAAEDIVELYLPDTSLNLGAPVATVSGVVNQSTFTKLSIGGTLSSANECQDFDEIRFGGSFESVTGVVANNTPINDVSLPAGISLYGYTGENPIESQAAFQTLIDNNQLSLVRWVNPADGQIKELYYTTFPSSSWINEIGDLTLGQGYVVKTTAACTLSISGNKSTTSVNLDLPAGYSIIGYNKETPMDAQAAFQSLIDANKLELVRWVDPSSGAIKELYYTTFPSPGWINEINNLTEGQGYIIKLNAPFPGFVIP